MNGSGFRVTTEVSHLTKEELSFPVHHQVRLVKDLPKEFVAMKGFAHGFRDVPSVIGAIVPEMLVAGEYCGFHFQRG